MKYLARILAPTLILLLFLPVLPASGQEQGKKPWTGKLNQGQVITEEDLRKIIEAHYKWLATEGKDGRRASPWGATLINVNLGGTNLTKAILAGANLTNANLMRATLTEAELEEANLTKAIYEPNPGSVPHIPKIATAKNLSTLTFRSSPHGLIELREGLKKAGLREQERQITYAIEHKQRMMLTSENPFSSLFLKKENEDPYFKYDIQLVSDFMKTSNKKEPSFFEKLGSEIIGWIRYFFIELTCSYGMTPWRPLLILIFVSIPFFTIPYVFCLRKDSKDGIWKVWSKERRRKDLPKDKDESGKPLLISGLSALKVAFYFSILSAFSIGWRELNVGNWIARVQRYEFNYRATGWARTVSGIQSLLSVYLLALWALTYFSRPFG